MLKPLLPAIPSKVLAIMGRDYHVYKFISDVYYRNGDKEYRQILLALNGYRKLSHVKLFRSLTNLKAMEDAIHYEIQLTIAKHHHYIEEHYTGDNYRFADLYDTCSVYVNEGYICIGYVHNTVPGVGITRCDKGVGNVKWITQEDIDTRVKEAMGHRRIMNTKYNELLAAKHQAYRDLINQQIKERDTVLNHPIELKETTMC